jgi:oxygen-independent coproporphyrinogen-3 oxidase
VYRDSVWEGCDMLGTGVASFSHMSGVHFQNAASWSDYLRMVKEKGLPLTRAFATNEHERLTREMILQLKKGEVRTEYFKKKFDADIIAKYGETYAALQREGMLHYDAERVKLTPQGLLRVDLLLHQFYAPKYRNARYT